MIKVILMKKKEEKPISIKWLRIIVPDLIKTMKIMIIIIIY